MITFFKPDTIGDEPQLFNGDYPYIHWAEPFSTGVIRYKSLYFVTDVDTVRVRMDVPNNWNFALFNEGGFDPINIESKDYTDINDIATGFVVLKGQKLGEHHLYQLNILCRSDVEGEYIETFYINEIPYRIGAEFWGENESLKINLANQGTEIPDSVGKAIYGSNVYDESPDWVLLNRKFRELLVNHIDIMDNKGSYKSLLNALQWFEYGDLVELREVWKYETPDGTKYYDHPINTMVNEEIRTRLFNSAKTTYFTLRNLKRCIVGHTDKPTYDETIYDHDPDDNTNVLNKIACQWTEADMVLKMVLLGNFLETYFMPIHSDLIRSVVEDISDFSMRLDFSTGNTEENSSGGGTRSFGFSWGDPDNSLVIPTDPLARHIVLLDEVHAYAGIDQPNMAFENSIEVVMDGSSVIPMIACHTYDEPNTMPLDELRLRTAIYGMVYNGPGAIEQANFEFDEPVVSGKCLSNQWGEFIETRLQSGSTKSLHVKFLFPKPGIFTFYFEFTGQSGMIYTKSVQIEVVDNLRVDISFYKLQSMSSRDYMMVNPFTANSNITPMLTIQRDHEYPVVDGGIVGTDIKYTRYIPFRTASNSSPMSAPCMTVVRTMQWAGANRVSKRDAYLVALWNKYNKDDYWMDKGEDIDIKDNSSLGISNPTAWVRICAKRKHSGLWNDFSAPNPPDKQFDLQVFFPELHELKKIELREHVDPHYPIICVPEIIIDGENSRRLNYSEMTGEPAWEFFSIGLNKTISNITIPQAISTNIIASAINTSMPRGMYRVTFRYKFGNTERTITKTPDWVLEKDA